MGAADGSARIWTSGWAPGEGVEATFSYHPHDEHGWHCAEDPQLEYRDADLGRATVGKVGARFVRAAAGAERRDGEWQAHDLDFELLYLQSGSLTIETDDGPQSLSAGDTCWMPPLYRHRISEYSPDFGAVEFASPARFERVIGRGAKLPARAGELDAQRRPVYTFERPESYAIGAGLRDYLVYRDLGTRALTDDRVQLHIIRVSGQQGEATGWHYHTMSQWFLVLGGHAEMELEGQPKRRVGPGDVVCVGSGPSTRHNVGAWSDDWATMEMCLPADYDTIPAEAPDSTAGG
jgi:quercetin dioxygenase-like cupin family protein